jgi:signal transduction histidine kinase/CheY-like chemotaxis protein
MGNDFFAGLLLVFGMVIAVVVLASSPFGKKLSQNKSSVPLLISGFFLIIFMVVAMGIGGHWLTNTLAELTSKMYQHPFTVSNAALKVNTDITEMRKHMLIIALTRNVQELEHAVSLVNEHEKKVYDNFDIIMERFLGDKNKIINARKNFSDWKAVREDIYKLWREDHALAVEAITSGKGAKHFALLIDDVNEMVDFAHNKAETFFSSSKEEHKQGLLILYLLLGIVVAVSVLIAFFVVSKINGSEKKLALAVNEAEAATIAKSDFLANMSHEIRTPMNAIIGLSHLALATELNHKQRDYITKVYNSGQNLLGLINDILDFSKVEADKLEMESIDFDLQEVLDNLTSMVALKASEKGLEFLIAAPSNLPTGLVGDPLRLGQILINLVNNAVKFTDEGEITVSISIQKPSGKDVALRFEVRDTGVGMTEKQRSKLFQAFSQADASTTRKYGGTGLGLTISKRLTEMMGGRIGVDSVYGEGSTFYFTAVFGHSSSKIKKRQIIPNDLEGMRVLITDDSSTSREIMAGFMNAFGFEYDEVASGSEAIKKLEVAPKDNPYRLVLMDWKMPGIDGIEASRRILQSKAISNKPAIIMVSAYGRDELMKQAEDVGVNGYLVKPVTQSMLFDTIMFAFDKEVEGVPVSSCIGAIPEIAEHVRGAHLLLVEDNAINQQVVQELLEKAGVTATIANNGQEAVEAVEKDAFDGILMDLQMPVMDGFEATQIIRKDERFKDMPIIAMTANAMAGDRERCLETGMNDHVAKPIEIKEFYGALAKWVKASNPALTPAPEAGEQGTESEELEIPELAGINVEDGLKRVAGNKRLYRSILLQFRDSAANTISELTTALNDGDIETATRIAHTLRGVAGNIGASDLQAVAESLESALNHGKSSGLESELKDIERQLAQVVPGLSVLDEDEEGSISSEEIDVEAITPLFAKLKVLLEDDDSEASEVLYELETRLKGSVVQAELKQLTKTVDQFDYEKALELLQDLMQTLHVTVDDSGGDS